MPFALEFAIGVVIQSPNIVMSCHFLISYHAVSAYTIQWVVVPITKLCFIISLILELYHRQNFFHLTSQSQTHAATQKTLPLNKTQYKIVLTQLLSPTVIFSQHQEHIEICYQAPQHRQVNLEAYAKHTKAEMDPAQKIALQLHLH